MYRIEKSLLSWGFSLKKTYKRSGVLVYTNKNYEPLYEVEVALYTQHVPKVWELTIYNPYSITLSSYRNEDEKDVTECQKSLIDDYVESAFEYKKLLKEIVDPFEEAE